MSVASLPPPPSPEARLGRLANVLVVDDEPGQARAFARVLRGAGHDVVIANDGPSALAATEAGGIDLVISDVRMPGFDGAELLRRIRERDSLLPMVLVSADPSVDVACRAMESGAHGYLVKPIAPKELIAVVNKALRGKTTSRQGNEVEETRFDRDAYEKRIGVALDTFQVVYRPIVSVADTRTVGFQAQVRCDESELTNFRSLVDSAAQLKRQVDVGRRLRRLVADDLASGVIPSDVFVLMPMHASDLTDPLIHEPSPLVPFAARTVLEVMDRAYLAGVLDPKRSIRRLRAMGYRTAMDDLAAGYAGLTSFDLLEPAFVKLDAMLMERAERRSAHLCATVLGFCRDLGVRLIAESVETPAERDLMLRLGCNLQQGPLYGGLQRPSLRVPA